MYVSESFGIERDENMAYADNYEVTKVYKDNYISMIVNIYQQFYNQVKDLYQDEQARQAAVATLMIPFTKAAGMDITGIITWDAEKAVSDDEFTTFAEQKSKGNYGSNGSGSYQKSYNKPSGNNYKQPYNNAGGTPKKNFGELKGPVTTGQIDQINSFLKDRNPEIVETAVRLLSEINVSEPEELSKQEASDIIGACFNVVNASRGRR